MNVVSHRISVCTFQSRRRSHCCMDLQRLRMNRIGRWMNRRMLTLALRSESVGWTSTLVCSHIGIRWASRSIHTRVRSTRITYLCKILDVFSAYMQQLRRCLFLGSSFNSGNCFSMLLENITSVNIRRVWWNHFRVVFNAPRLAKPNAYLRRVTDWIRSCCPCFPQCNRTFSCCIHWYTCSSECSDTATSDSYYRQSCSELQCSTHCV